MSSLASQFSADAGTPPPSDDPSWRVPPAVQAARDATGAQLIASEPDTPTKEKAAALSLLTHRGKAAPDSSATLAVPASGLASQFAADAGAPPPTPSAAAQATKAWQATVTPTGSATENALAGAGKAVSDMGLGLKQLADVPAQWLERKFPGVSKWAEANGFPSAASSAAATNASVAASRQADAPLMNTGAGIAGNVAGNIAMTLLPAAGLAKAGVPGAAAMVNPATYGAAAGAGAIQGALQPTIDGESKVRNALIGGAAGVVGNGLVNAVGRVAQPVGHWLSDAHGKAVQVLQDAGVPLDAAQQTGSAFLNKVRSSLSDNPFTAGAQSELQGAQQAAYNRAVLKTVGENAIAATPDVMASAARRINGVFSDTLNRTQVNATNDFPFLNRLTDIQKGALAAEKTPVSNYVNRIIGAADQNGQIPGQVAYGIKKELDALSNTADSTQNYWARSLNSALKDQMSASMTPADAAAFDTARAQFAKLKTIEPAIDRVGGGDISAAKLANTLATKQNRQFSIYGRGDNDLVDLAQAGNLLLKDKAPNSGSVSRALIPIGIGAVGGGALDTYNGDYGSAVRNAALGAGVGIALPKLVQAGMNSPAVSGYLANGVNGPLRALMLAPQTAPLVGGAVRRVAPPLNSVRLLDLAQQNSP